MNDKTNKLKCSDCGIELLSFDYGRPKVYQIGELRPYYKEADPLCKSCWVKYDVSRKKGVINENIST